MEVLIVDDEILIRDGLAKELDWAALGFESVITTENGIEALAHIDMKAPDLILTDIRMPFMTGLEMTEKLRENHADICIIIISGHEEFEYAKAAIKFSVFEYILKPINLNELSGAVARARQWIERKAIREENEYFKMIGWKHNIDEDYSEMQRRVANEHGKDAGDIDDCEVSELQNALADGGREEIMAAYDMMKKKFSEMRRCHQIILRIACSNIFFAFKSNLESNGGDLEAIFDKPTHVFHSIIICESMDEMFDALDSAVGSMLDYRDDLTTGKYMNEVEIAERYIKKNYTDFSLSLDDVANHVKKNPCYFSTVFKKKSGMSFTNYLTNLRIEKAMALLKGTDMRTYEISYEIGYENPSYFSTVFKRITGMSPKDFRDSPDSMPQSMSQTMTQSAE